MKVPLERENRGAAGNTAGLLTALLLFICIISVAYYTWQKSINPSASPEDILQIFAGSANEVVKDAELEFKFDFDAKEEPEFSVFGDYIAKSNVNGIWLLDKKGDTVWSESISLNKPIIKVNGSRLLVADTGACEIIVLEGRNIAWRNTIADASILNADISEDGYVTVISTSKRYNNEISVFDPNGIELFKKIIANDFAVNAGIAPNEKMLAVSEISTSTYGAYSGYKLYDFNSNDPTVHIFDKSGELLPLFLYNSDSSLFAAGDSAVAYIDSNEKLKWEKRYTSVAGAYLAGDGRLAVAAENSSSYLLALLDEKGQENSTVSLAFKPDGMAAIKGIIAVFDGDTAHFYNNRCKNICTFSADSKIRQVCFFNRHQAAVITGKSIAVININ